MIGTLVNAAAVLVGGAVGLLLKKGMPARVAHIYFQAIGLFTFAIGVALVVKMDHMLLVVGSLALGSLIGEWLDLETAVENLSNHLKRRFRMGSERFSEGLVTAFLLYCIGAMTIVGAINEGTGGSSEVLLTKSLMDGFSSVVLASAFGVGVLFAAVPLLVFQGGITLVAMFAGSFFTPDIIHGMSSVGGILLMGLGINILEIKKLRITNMLPSLLLIIFLLWVFA
ncbi:MAG TPA: DUF554 domain-containing protein [Paludibacter sp.]|nr:DUF554 domain-containing protein [Paludibacter sp.]